MPYGQILPYLIKSGLMVPKEIKIIPPLYPLGYNVNAICNFHDGAPEHTVENYKALKYKVKDLKDYKAISFIPSSLNVKNNHMHMHVGPSVNVFEESTNQDLVDVV